MNYPDLQRLRRSFRRSLTNRVSNASSGQLTNTKNLMMMIAVFHRRLTTLVPNAVSQTLDLTQKLSEGYSQVQRYTLLQNLLDSDTGTNCVYRGIQLLPRHYCAAGQIGIYSTKWLLLPSMAHYVNHSIWASLIDGFWWFLAHPFEVESYACQFTQGWNSSPPAANPSLPARKGNARRFRSNDYSHILHEFFCTNQISRALLNRWMKGGLGDWGIRELGDFTSCTKKQIIPEISNAPNP